MATKNEKKVLIQINSDPLNEENESHRVFQVDGETVQVPIGVITEVPKVIAEIAVRCGYCNGYTEI